jgi:hypothetical protein
MVPGSKTEDVVPPYSRLFVLEYDPFYRWWCVHCHP